MLRGFNYSLTPKGQSTLNPPPPAWIGEGSLTLPVCRGEEISDLAPVRSGKGIRASMAYVVDDLKTLKDLRK